MLYKHLSEEKSSISRIYQAPQKVILHGTHKIIYIKDLRLLISSICSIFVMTCFLTVIRLINTKLLDLSQSGSRLLYRIGEKSVRFINLALVFANIGDYNVYQDGVQCKQ